MHKLLQNPYSDPVLFTISDGLITGCAVCKQNVKDLKKCSGCNAINYCGREHQLADRPNHKTFCNMVKAASEKVKKEVDKINKHPGDMFMPKDPFNTCVGHFWGIHETRDYMRARYAVVEGLAKINTELSVKTALDILLDMLRLCQGDNMGIRALVPALYLRLNRDQDCYDFIKWYATTGNDRFYDWGDMDLPFLDVQNADVFEPVDGFTGEYVTELSHLLALTLLKIRLLMDVTSLDPTNKEAVDFFPAEVITIIQEQGPTSRFGDNLEKIKQDQTKRIQSLVKQIIALYDAVNKANKFLWPAVLKPGKHLYARPNFMSRGDPMEMQLTLQYNYNAWKESPGSIKVVEKLSEMEKSSEKENLSEK